MVESPEKLSDVRKFFLYGTERIVIENSHGLDKYMCMCKYTFTTYVACMYSILACSIVVMGETFKGATGFQEEANAPLANLCTLGVKLHAA